MLELIDIETCYGRKQVLFGIHLKLSEGGAVALIGRNGMGKTTTVRSIMGFTPARRGRIIFDGREITRFPSYQIARAGIGVRRLPTRGGATVHNQCNTTRCSTG
jgi:branched-chain amino acid transport system ATP-binding protein